MKAAKKSTTGVVIVLLLVFGAPLAHAFFPLGGYDSFDVRRFMKYSFAEFDTDNDGDIEADEGVGVILEAGPRGFTSDELEVVEEALQVWEDVPTSYASFRIEGYSQDILPSGIIPDGLNTIMMEVTTLPEDEDEDIELDPADVLVGVGNGVLGVTLILFSVDDVQVEVGGSIVTVPAGTIIDNDIVIDATTHRRQTASTEPEVELKATLVHELGHFLGLGHTPLNNLREIVDEDTGLFELLESEPLALTGSDGVQRRIGATPTMFPFLFSVEDLDGEVEGIRDGASDLALDDISAISWLYPRGSQANFFSVDSEARTRVRDGAGLPSTPILGGHIVAWADADNLDSTERVPLFSTTSGLYERVQNLELWGQFSLRGMWKQLELVGAPNQLFTPTYTFTLSPLNQTGAPRQAPLGVLAEEIDSLAGPTSFSVNVRDTGDYFIGYPSEVFQEVENILDVSNKDAGTPMYWDFAANTLLSEDTGRTLNTILNGRHPMFGEPNDVCPLNIIQSPTGESTTTTETTGTLTAGADRLRGLRDRYLLPSLFGTVIVDTYYQVAPSFARFLLAHPRAFDTWKMLTGAMFWTLENPMKLIAGSVLIGLLALFLRKRRAAAVASALVLAASALMATPAHALIEYLRTDEMVDRTDCVVTGKVMEMNGRRGLGGRIYTDITVRVENTVGCDIIVEGEGEDQEAGESGVDQFQELTVLGGEKDGLVMFATSMPRFRVGEEVLLYLKEIEDTWIIYAGERGKFSIITVSATGEKFVNATNPTTEQALKEDSQAAPLRTDSKGNVFLDDYLDYIQKMKSE